MTIVIGLIDLNYMNILNLTNKGYSARFFAGITIVSLLLSAFPAAFFVANAASLYSSASASADMSAEFASGNIDASGFNNLVLSFDFDASELDGTAPADSFTYGWRDAGGDNDIATFNGLAGADPAEVSSISTPLPSAAQVADLEVYVKVVANTATDVVDLANISVSGDVVPAGTVWNSTDDLYFTTLQEAIDAATTGTGDVIELTADLTVATEVGVDKSIVLDGNGFTISPNFIKESTPGSNSVLQVNTDNVIIKDVVIDGTGGTNLHGINTYKIEDLELQDVSLLNNDYSGLVVNGSVVIVTDITTSGNGWHGINVDLGTNVTDPAELTVEGSSSHDEALHIYVDDTTEAVSVIDSESQYDVTNMPFKASDRLYTLKALPDYPCESTDTLENTTFDTFTLGDVDAQNGWSSTGSFDQEVVTNTYGYSDFGCQSLRVSNAVTSGSFGDQTFAAPIPDSVGESDATTGSFSEGTRYNHFEIEFDIASAMPNAKQDDLALSVSPDRGDGSRMSYLSFADTDDGISVTFTTLRERPTQQASLLLI